MELGTTSTFEQVRGRLLPSIEPPDDRPGIELVPGYLSVSLVLDGVDGSRHVDARDLRTWKVTFEAAFSVAMDNLRRTTLARDFHAVHTAPGLYAWVGQDGLAPARALLVRELLRPWPFAGAILALPTPDQLLVLSLSDMTALEALPMLVETRNIAHALGARPVSEELFWHDGNELHVLEVKHTDEGVVIQPLPAFLRALKRLAALELSGPVAEA
jgi:hypothetical protein